MVAAAAAGASGEGAAGSIRYFNWNKPQRTTARAAMATLVAALADDPVNAYFCGTRRRRFVKDEVKGYLKALRSATHFITTPDSNAVALWQLLPAETPRNELWAGWTRILAVTPRLWAQLLRLELKYEAAHGAAAASHGPYYYLSFIGTAPGCRGQGLGSRLLAEVTARADREGRWCLLEATSEASEALYARHGFVTYEVYRVSTKAPPVFLMKRPPQAASSLQLRGATANTAPGAAAAAAAPEAAAVAPLESATAVGALAAAIAGKEASAAAGADVQQQLLVSKQQQHDARLAAGLSSHALIAVGNAAELVDSDSEEGSDEEKAETAAGDGGGVLLPGAASEPAAAADARVIIRSASSSSLMQGKGGLGLPGGTEEGLDPAPAASVTQASSQAGVGSSSGSAGAGGPSSAI